MKPEGCVSDEVTASGQCLRAYEEAPTTSAIGQDECDLNGAGELTIEVIIDGERFEHAIGA